MLKFIGCGSAFNTKLGNTSAYFKTDDNKTLNLIDCGEDVFGKLKSSEILEKLEQVNIFITHLHSDHVGSLSTLIYYCYYVLKIKVVVFYPNAELDMLLKLQGMTGEEYLYRKLYKAHINEATIVYEENLHLEHTRCYSLYINNHTNEKSYFYSGDTTLSIIYGKDNYELIYHDVSTYGGVHPKFDDFYEMHKNTASKICLMHFDSDELIQKCRDAGFKVAIDYM